MGKANYPSRVDNERARQLIGIADHLADPVSKEGTPPAPPHAWPHDSCNAAARHAKGLVNALIRVRQDAERRLVALPERGRLLWHSHGHQGDIGACFLQPGAAFEHAGHVSPAQRAAEVAEEDRQLVVCGVGGRCAVRVSALGGRRLLHTNSLPAHDDLRPVAPCRAVVRTAVL